MTSSDTQNKVNKPIGTNEIHLEMFFKMPFRILLYLHQRSEFYTRSCDIQQRFTMQNVQEVYYYLKLLSKLQLIYSYFLNGKKVYLITQKGKDLLFNCATLMNNDQEHIIKKKDNKKNKMLSEFEAFFIHSKEKQKLIF